MPWFEDVSAGDQAELGQHLFIAEEIIRFASAFDPQPFHLSEEAGRASIFGGLAASGWHTVAIWQRLTIEHDLKVSTASERNATPNAPAVRMSDYTELRWLKPVLAGDTITYRNTVTDLTEQGAPPGWGIALILGEGFNQRGERAFHVTARQLLKIRA